ncbi:MAG: two-component hybrid sensor and regulator, partial [Capsulimonas sp.]|nr:two-component hybrid sensor and regulator [Capsulimonas sp.]
MRHWRQIMSSSPPARILIVDDEAAQMKALCDTLRDQGYETVGFTTGPDALAALGESEFDLLLADLMMPEMDGIALLRAAMALNPNLVGIIMTGDGAIATAVEAMKTGAIDYILKPFKLSHIIPVLSRALTMRRLRLEKTELERDLRTRTEQLEAANKELETYSQSVTHDLGYRVGEIEALFDILPVPIAIAEDPQGEHIRVNPAFASILGIPPDSNALASTPDGERAPFRMLRNGASVPDGDLPMQQAALRGMDIRDAEIEIERPDGQTRRLLGYASPLYDEAGRVRGSVGAFMDITERHRTERNRQFLLDLADRTRGLLEPDHVLMETANALSAHMDGARCGNMEWDSELGAMTIRHGDRDGVASIPETYPRG